MKPAWALEMAMACARCGADHAPEMGLCPACGRPLHPAKSPFGALEARLASLRAEVARGAATAVDHQARVAELQLRDRRGAAWWLNEAGQWTRWDGAHWAAAAPALEASKHRFTRWWIPVVGAAAILALVAVAVGGFLYGGWVDYVTSPMLVEGVEPVPAAGGGYQLRPEQQAAVVEHGYPQAFSILFFDRQSADGALENVRLETWDYYNEGLRLTFVNGVLEEEEALDVIQDANLVPLPYTPEQFVAYMGLDEVLAAAGLDSYLAVPLESQVLDGGAVYYAEALSFGLKDGELRYVEALALEGEG